MAGDSDFTIHYVTEYGTAPEDVSTYTARADGYFDVSDYIPSLTDSTGANTFVGWTVDGDTILQNGDMISVQEYGGGQPAVVTFTAVWEAAQKHTKTPFLDRVGLTHLWQVLIGKLAGKVDKEDGKGLSTNDYTDEEKETLSSIFSDYLKATDKTELSDAITAEIERATKAEETLDAKIPNLPNPSGKNKYMTTDGSGVCGWSERFDAIEKRVYNVIPEKSISFSASESPSGQAANLGVLHFNECDCSPFIPDNFLKPFTVIIDGVTYSDVPLERANFKDSEEYGYFLGDMRILGAETGLDYDFAFLFALFADYAMLYLPANEDPASHTIQVIFEEDRVVPKNLPVGVPNVPVSEEDNGKYMRVVDGEWNVEYVEEPKPDWNECSYDSKHYVNNRTHYETAYSFTYDETSLSKYTSSYSANLTNLNIGVSTVYTKLIYCADISVADFETMVTDLPTDSTKVFAELNSGRYGVAIESPNEGYIVLVLVQGKGITPNGVYIAQPTLNKPMDTQTYFTATFGGSVVKLDPKFLPTGTVVADGESGTNMMLVTDANGVTKWDERTHYDNTTELVLFEADNGFEGMESHGDGYWNKYVTNDTNHVIVNGQKYKVNYGDNESVVVAGEGTYQNTVEVSDVPNLGYIRFNTTDYGLCVETGYDIYSSSHPSMALKLSYINEETKPLNEKFIPETIARVSDISALTTSDIDEVCQDFVLDEASAVLSEIAEIVG